MQKKSGTSPIWQKGRLKDLPIEIIDGDRSHRYPKEEEFQNDGIIFLNSTIIKDNKLDYDNANFISNETFARLTKGKLKNKDIVLTTRGNGIGKVVLFNNPRYQTGFINAQMLIFRPDSQTLDPIFLFYLLCDEKFQGDAKNYATGSAQPQLPIINLNKIEICYPIISTQQKIATLLSTYDDLIENNTRRIHILEEMAQTIYREWFVNFRFPGHEGVRMVESELGPVPEGWEIKSVDETFEITGGGTPSTKIPEYWEDGIINWYSPVDLTSSGSMFMDSSNNKITELGLKKSSAKLFPAFSVMMTSRATLGVIAINTTNACTNQGFITCIPNERFPVYLLYHWLKENVESFISLGTGSTFKEITKGVFRTVPVLIPPSEIVRRFEKTIEPVSKEILNMQRKNTNLRRTRDLLLPKLISGEIDVSDLDIQIPEAEA